MEKGLGECKDIEGKVRDMEQGMNNKKDVVAIQTWRWRWWRPLSTLALGQVLSLLITASGVSSSRLAFLGIHAPTTQSLCNYVLLAIVYGTIFLHQKRKIKVQWYYYAILAIVDVEANYLAVKAYQYTTITSILLLDKGSLLFVLALTWFILKKKHTLGELGGVIVCMGGVVVLFFSDVQSNLKKGTNELIKGDTMVLIASFLYAISNVIEEVILRKDGFVEITTWLGIFGSIISSCQLCILEVHEIKSMKWSVFEVLPFIGFAISLFTFYTLVPIFLKLNGSTSLNVSLISSDIWATLVKKFVFRQNNSLRMCPGVALGLSSPPTLEARRPYHSANPWGLTARKMFSLVSCGVFYCEDWDVILRGIFDGGTRTYRSLFLQQSTTRSTTIK